MTIFYCALCSSRLILGQGVIVGQSGWQNQLEYNKQQFVNSFVARSEFRVRYGGATAASYVDSLNQNAGGVLSQSDRNAYINGLNSGSETAATMLRKVAENPLFDSAEFNRAFVLMQYFGYLRRDPDAPPDSDFGGYNFWLSKLNSSGGDYIGSQMVRSFIVSAEYRKRFGLQ